jgi:hypothetical protein
MKSGLLLLPPTQDLNALILAREEITQLHHDVQTHSEAALRKGIRIGGKLVGLQAQLKPFKNYEKWIKANLPFSPRTSRDYVTLYRNRELIEHESSADSPSIRAALKLIADTAKAVTPVEISTCPLEINVDAEQVPEEEDPVKLADRETLLVEAEPGFIAELVTLIRRAKQAGHKIKFERHSAFAPNDQKPTNFGINRKIITTKS